MSSASKPKSFNFGRIILGLFLVLIVIGLFGWVFRAPLLRGVAHFWIIDEPLTKADAILVLGGGIETRPFEAARLYHQHFAPRIIIPLCRTNPVAQIGLTQSETELTRAVLIKQNVPESAITVIGNGVTNTFDEAVALHGWIEQNPATNIIVCTDLFHTRRVRWIFHRELKSTSVHLAVHPAPDRNFTSDNWWLHVEGILSFQSEFLKSVYYHFHY